MTPEQAVLGRRVEEEVSGPSIACVPPDDLAICLWVSVGIMVSP